MDEMNNPNLEEEKSDIINQEQEDAQVPTEEAPAEEAPAEEAPVEEAPVEKAPAEEAPAEEAPAEEAPAEEAPAEEAPAEEAPVEEAPVEEAPAEEAPAEEAGAAPAKKLSKSKLAIIIGAALGAVTVITLVLLLAFGVFSGKDDSPTPNEPGDNVTDNNNNNNNNDDDDNTVHTHSYGKWTVKSEPTCVSSGTEQRSCSCGAKESRKIDATGIHTFGKWTTINEATCVIDGASERTCKYCGEKETKVLAAPGVHSFGAWTTVTAATCTEGGVEERTCSCGETETRAIAMVDHSYVSAVVEPTVSTDGYTEYLCYCGHSYRDNIKPHFGSHGLTYEIIDARSVRLVSAVECLDSEVIIPEYHEGRMVVEIAADAFKGCHGVLEVTIPSTVTIIGDNIFADTENLHTVYYNSAYESDDNKFLAVPSIDRVVFGGASVSNVAQGLMNVKSVEILSTVREIQAYAFANCSALTSVIFEDGVEDIGVFAFADCYSLYNLSLPSGIEIIDNGAFYGCYSLNNVSFRGSVGIIGYDAFYGCSSLAAVSVSDIADWCNTSFSHAASNPLYYAHNLYLDSDPTEPIRTIFVPEIEAIGNFVFYGCESVYEIVLPETVTSIGRSAFYGCKAMTSVNIPAAVTSIDDEAFRNCYALTSVEIPSGVTGIGWSTFYDCKSLSSVSIPNSVTVIGHSAFYGCERLRAVVLPAELTSIGQAAFYGCIRLRSITMPATVNYIGALAFCDCIRIDDIYYGGTTDDFDDIDIDISNNPYLDNAKISYGYIYEEDIPEEDTPETDTPEVDAPEVDTPEVDTPDGSENLD